MTHFLFPGSSCVLYQPSEKKIKGCLEKKKKTTKQTEVTQCRGKSYRKRELTKNFASY